jgi:L-iditol 2-dehydrogenase
MLILPDSLSFERAAFCEPLANVVHGAERTGIKAGDTVGIIGIGPIGLMFARIAKLMGAKVIVAGRNPIKLKAAKEFAQADEIVDLTKYKNPNMIFKEFSNEGLGLDVAIECVGLPEIWEQIFDCVRPGGTVHFFGGCKSGSKVCLDTTKIHYGDIKIMSVFHHTPKYFRKALDYIASGDIEVEKLITETLPLEKVEYAMQQHIEGKAIKFLINPWA